MSDLPANIVALIDYDGTWDGVWAEAANPPIEIDAYRHAGYIRDDIFDARISTLTAERDEARARVAAVLEEAARHGKAAAYRYQDPTEAIRALATDAERDALAAALDKARAEERKRLRAVIADAVRRPMGVVPASADELLSNADLDAAEARRVAAIRARGEGDE